MFPVRSTRYTLMGVGSEAPTTEASLTIKLPSVTEGQTAKLDPAQWLKDQAHHSLAVRMSPEVIAANERRRAAEEQYRNSGVAPVETLETGESPTPTADQVKPGAGVAPPAGAPYGPVGPSDDTLFGLPKKAVLIGGAALAALLLLKS